MDCPLYYDISSSLSLVTFFGLNYVLSDVGMAAPTFFFNYHLPELLSCILSFWTYVCL